MTEPFILERHRLMPSANYINNITVASTYAFGHNDNGNTEAIRSDSIKRICGRSLSPNDYGSNLLIRLSESNPD